MIQRHWFHLSEYKRDANKSGAGQNIHNCDFKLPPPAGKVCDVDVSLCSPCVEDNGFAYHKSTPCIFLKLNKIYGWKPEFYNSSDNLPSAMPDDLKEHIKNMTAYNKNYVSFYLYSYRLHILIFIPASKDIVTNFAKKNQYPVSYLAVSIYFSKQYTI